jgi:hypothetical protein
MEQFKEEILSVVNSLKESEDFITYKTSEDPQTQTVSWDVDYTPNLKNFTLI